MVNHFVMNHGAPVLDFLVLLHRLDNYSDIIVGYRVGGGQVPIGVQLANRLDVTVYGAGANRLVLQGVASDERDCVAGNEIIACL